jgi:hypothetical protein
MNERIRELVEKSYIYDKQNDSSFFNKEKFAQLIIRECAEIAYNKQYKHSSAHTRGDCAKAIKQHFGVEL